MLKVMLSHSLCPLLDGGSPTSLNSLALVGGFPPSTLGQANGPQEQNIA